jgi:hypothetical protein
VTFSKNNLPNNEATQITRGTKEHFSHPVIRAGVLYQRRGDALMAFDIRGQGFNQRFTSIPVVQSGWLGTGL